MTHVTSVNLELDRVRLENVTYIVRDCLEECVVVVKLQTSLLAQQTIVLRLALVERLKTQRDVFK